MSGPVQTGIVDALPFQTIRGRDQGGGEYLEYVYRGNEDTMRGVYTDSLNYAVSQTLDHDGPTYTCRVRVPASTASGDPETPVYDVRLTWNRIQKDILQHPAFRAASIDEETIRLCRNALRNYAESGVGFSIPFPAANAVLQDAFAGVENFLVFQPVVVKTATVSNRYQFNLSWANVGCIISTASLSAELEGYIRFSLPNWGSNNPARYDYGWLKLPPDYQTSGRGLYTSTQQWEYGLWAKSMYSFA